ncbi:hypothetical protein Sru01_69460 [Sphaerisporangium rufum]|uniref:Uncharacterized protein n=1 Tax=Sphaerisporangium rufum TaxID=1381558 RepID=A0A919R9N7_9ACTN|nr:hypothetical protein Sru01_69460 [Sphaerisporangium rufum]
MVTDPGPPSAELCPSVAGSSDRSSVTFTIPRRPGRVVARDHPGRHDRYGGHSGIHAGDRWAAGADRGDAGTRPGRLRRDDGRPAKAG